MNLLQHLALAAAIFVAGACSPQVAPSAPEEATPTAADGEKPGGEQNAALTPAMLVGRWGDNGDCTKDIVFDANGAFRSYTGGLGSWTLVGDRMTMTGSGGAFEVRVQVINSNTLIVHNPDGSVGTSQRC